MDEERKREILENWFSMLRSGEYTKTGGELCDDIGHCAIGLLWLAAGGTYNNVHLPVLSEELAEFLKEPAGVNPTKCSPYTLGTKLMSEKTMDQVWKYNDSAVDPSFEEIADLFEPRIMG